MRDIRGPLRSIALVAALTAPALVLAACGNVTKPLAATTTVTPVPTVVPTATPAPATPTPTPTPSPAPAPQPTATAAALTVAGPPPAPTPFPTPPPRAGTLPPNDTGIARMVAPGLIRDLYIEVVHVVNNQMQAPVDGEYSVGWYPEYGKPGVAGNAIFSAHETWNHFAGPFYQLHLARPGDGIDIQMTDGTTYRYSVISNHRYPLATIPMGEILWPKERPPDAQWITLMTCGGTIVYNDTGYGEFLDRDIIVAKRIE